MASASSPHGEQERLAAILRNFKVQGRSHLRCQGRSRTRPTQAMRRIAQNKPSKSGKFFEGFDAKRPGAKASGAKSLVHLSHLVRSGQLECHQLAHCKQATSKSSENLPERRPSSGEVDLPASTEPPRCCKKKGRRGTSVFPGDALLGGAALGEHFFGVFRGHEKGRTVGALGGVSCGRD